MYGFSWRRLRDDDGISLVEVMVGMSIILVSLAAFASTLTQSMSVVSRDEQLVRANQFAAEMVEFARAVPFDCQGDAACINGSGQLGFYQDDPGWSAVASDGEPMVNLGPSRPTIGSDGAPGPVPLETINRDGIDYRVTREIVWVDDPATPGTTEDHKEIRIGLAWTVGESEYSTATSAVRYDAPEPVEECTPGTIISYDVSPDFVLISDSGNNLDSIVVTVETCSPAAYVTLTPLPLVTRNMTEVPGSDGTRWEVRDIADGNVQFATTAYEWTVEMHADGGGTDQAVTNVRFAEPGTEVLDIANITVTPSTFCLRKEGSTFYLQSAADVAVDLTGAVAGDAVRIGWTGAPDGTAATSVGSVDELSAATVVLPIPANTTFDFKTSGNNPITTSTITVSATRVSDQAPVSRSAVVDLQLVGTAPC